MDTKDLWKLCEKQGMMADVYIARKLSKIGRRFAFVRFLKIQKFESLIESLKKVWIDSYHLFAAMTRFSRKPNGSHKASQKNYTTHHNPNPEHYNPSSHANPNRSYVSDLYGNASENPKSFDKTIMKSVTLDASDLLDMSDMSNVILAKLQSNKEMSWYFTLIKHITQMFKPDERMVWIEISGLPLNAWNTKAFKKVTGIWGEPLFVDEDSHDNVAMGRVCIKSKIHGQISETCKVVIHGKAHSVWVKEFAGWVPDIKGMEDSSCNISEAGNSDNHDQEVNECDLHKAEEGELQKPTGIQEDEVVKNTQWSDDVYHFEKDQVASPIITESNKQQTNQYPRKYKEDSESISKPPGFESFKNKNSQYSKQASKNSFVAAQTSRASKSHSKSIKSQGSMIEAFISHIEMGNILGYDIEGSKNDLKKFIDCIGGIQETHSIKIKPLKVKRLWGNFRFDFATSPSSGRSGGLVSIWDPDMFHKLNMYPTENLLIIEGIWKSSLIHCYMINVYAPQDDRKKEALWHYILDHMECNQGHYFIFGDFNVVRNATERIENTTFLLHSYHAQVIECHISDHRPILLTPSTTDFGPTPFKFYNSWIMDKNLQDIVIDFWNQHEDCCPNPIVRFGIKMKALKTLIKDWTDISDIGSQRINWLTELRNIEAKKSLDYSQKAKIKWGIEADENSKFFHASVNQKRIYLSIHGIKHEGQWISDPLRIKEIFHSFFKLKFQKVEAARIVRRSPFYISLSDNQNQFLTSPICDSEIRDAVWDCGSDKSSGPDGFTFAFYKKFWDTIKKDVVGFVQDFFTSGSLPRGCNTSFIALIPKVSNPMVVSDFRPISLHGAQYKIIVKVLAN
nr:RNA-directed DNA polymerase, eukaryota [Tanacetum cinerariifolium]